MTFNMFDFCLLMHPLVSPAKIISQKKLFRHKIDTFNKFIVTWRHNLILGGHTCLTIFLRTIAPTGKCEKKYAAVETRTLQAPFPPLLKVGGAHQSLSPTVHAGLMYTRAAQLWIEGVRGPYDAKRTFFRSTKDSGLGGYFLKQNACPSLFLSSGLLKEF